jgi:hypothetical protein
MNRPPISSRGRPFWTAEPVLLPRRLEGCARLAVTSRARTHRNQEPNMDCEKKTCAATDPRRNEQRSNGGPELCLTEAQEEREITSWCYSRQLSFRRFLEIPGWSGPPRPTCSNKSRSGWGRERWQIAEADRPPHGPAGWSGQRLVAAPADQSTPETCDPGL